MLCTKNNKQLEEINTLQKEDKLKKQIELLIKKVGTTNYNSTINNTMKFLNNYGEEDISHITDALKSQTTKNSFWYDS